MTLEHINMRFQKGGFFSKDRSVHVLKDIDLTIGEGEILALVGESGCGKTTLSNLLMRFYDVDKGCVSVDGHDIREITRKSLRSHYGMVLQETWLKKATVRENLLMGNPEATEEEMI